MPRIVALLIVAALVAGCQPETGGGGNAGTAASPGAVAIAAPPPVAFQCPPAGTRITYGGSRTRTFRGADPADPAICLATTGTGTEERLMLLLHPLPWADEAQNRSSFGALWPLSPGRSVTFASTNNNGMNRWQESWRVEGAERVTVAGAPRDVLVLRRTLEGQFGNPWANAEIYWYDLATRAFIRRQVQVLRGGQVNAPFEATRIETGI